MLTIYTDEDLKRNKIDLTRFRFKILRERAGKPWNLFQG